MYAYIQEHMLKRTYSVENYREPCRRLRQNHYEVERRMQLVKNARFGLARVQNLPTFYSWMHPPREIFFIYFFISQKKAQRLTVLIVCASA